MDIDDILEESEPEEQDLDKIIKTFLKPENIHHLTELSHDEANAFTTLYSFARNYDIEVLKEWLATNLMLRVSKARKGRKEFVRITQRAAEREPERTNRWYDFRR